MSALDEAVSRLRAAEVALAITGSDWNAAIDAAIAERTQEQR